MHAVLYLHGFGERHPETSLAVQALKAALPQIPVLSPCYHPAGQIWATRIGNALDEFGEIIRHADHEKVHVVGYSFGGWLAALLAERQPESIVGALLLAPAIDNFARNYEQRNPADWHMPRSYVEELRGYEPRPRIICPTTLVHGCLDDDSGGAAPWRIREWARQEPFQSVYLLRGVGHSLEPWLSAESRTNGSFDDVPTFRELASDLISG